MGAGVFHVRVRDGIGCINSAMTTGPPRRISDVVVSLGIGWCDCVAAWCCVRCLALLRGETAVLLGWEIYRAIRTARLHALPRFYLRPIDVMVYHGPRGRPRLEGGFLLRCLQQLSRPHLATQRCPWRDNWCTRGASIPVLSY